MTHREFIPDPVTPVADQERLTVLTLRSGMASSRDEPNTHAARFDSALSLPLRAQAGFVTDLPGVRALLLRPAEDASSEYYPRQMLLTSSVAAGRLAITSCIGYGWDTRGVHVDQSVLRVASQDGEGELVTGVNWRDYAAPINLTRLTDLHLDRLDMQGVDVAQNATDQVRAVDLQVVRMLQLLSASV